MALSRARPAGSAVGQSSSRSRLSGYRGYPRLLLATGLLQAMRCMQMESYDGLKQLQEGARMHVGRSRWRVGGKAGTGYPLDEFWISRPDTEKRSQGQRWSQNSAHALANAQS
jgi:hypothetical protein